jgi:hypothetical protein
MATRDIEAVLHAGVVSSSRSQWFQRRAGSFR